MVAPAADVGPEVFGGHLYPGPLGVGGAIAASRLVSNLLFGLAPTDPMAMVGAMTVMVLVSALAGYLPARRASRVDPMVALRYE